MTAKMTGKEFKAFYSDSYIWPKDSIIAYQQEEIFLIDGFYVGENWDKKEDVFKYLKHPNTIPDDIMIQGEYIRTDSSGKILEKKDLLTVFNCWVEKQDILSQSKNLEESLPKTSKKNLILKI